MSTKKHSPQPKRSEALSGRLSKSASELSCAPPAQQSPPPRARSAHHHTPLSVVHRTQHFFTNLKSRWQRSRSRERCPAGTIFSLAPGVDSSSEYADSSHSTPAHSPRHRQVKRDLSMTRQSTDPTPSTSGTPAHHPRPHAELLQLEPDEGQKLRERLLRQHSFFQLRIHLKRGQNLVAMDKNGTSDPYVKFKAGGRLLHKSKIVYRDLNPVWDEVFTVPIEDPFQAVQIKVFDYDWGLQDDFMGSCHLDLTALELGRSQDLVLCLRDHNKPHQDMGEIVMNVTLLPKSQEDKEQYLLKNTRLSDVNKRLKAQIWSSVVTIVLVEAKNLPAMDMDTRSSDPYCKFRLGNEKYKSKVVWKSLHPSWLEQFDLHLYDDQEQILEVTVWDKDKQTKDDFLGRCTIDLSKLEREKTHNIWQDLEDGNGQIFLLLTISGTTQSETITDLTSYRENPKDIEIIERRYTWYRVKEQAAGAGWLCVKVYGAAGLAAADLGGKSDPFCVLELGNARLQTHTEYKTLAPNWMKIFTFTVKDICSYLELTVYDEDHDHKVEFLGKLTIPLLTIRNGEKRWYALKDKKMRARAKGNYPQILLEMTVIWNPLKAAIRAVNPKEPKYMHQEAKFKRQLFIRNVMRLKAIIMWFIEIGKILQDCFEWESKLLSFMGLLAWLAFCYYYEMWMLPFLLLVFFSRNWLIYRLTVRLKRSYKSYKNNPWEYIKQIFGRGNPLLVPVDDDDLLAEEDDEDEADKEEKKSLKERLQAIQEVTQTVQNAIGYVASFGEAVKNLMNFTVPYLSYLAILMLFGAMIVLYIIPLRYLLMAWGINKFTRKILRPHTIPNNEVIDLLSRVPDDEILLDCRELKPHPINENRRDLRKKHKAS
ncbi:multiple C2 and transmembrane domain-containing protein isoform X2 [Plodia interpunctella]|uniref:multiple C2 and transmembrane domain-containing protein isoform X2 n=1 Tax=Plodia interpunctella TaxID=58824 RepID=UPI00236895AC|nr:multiple C2 and transmembrane domain-containing protein isoform X2 [Plodia interpunctella]